MIDPKIHTFLVLSWCKSTTRCAEELHITQPAVSQHIRSLENTYGVKLFVKEGRRLVLTQEGRHFERLCSRLVTLDEQITREMKESGRPTVRFGATLSICEGLMPAILPRMVEQYPDIRFHMEQENTQVLLERMDGGSLDFVLAEGNFDHTAYDYEPFYESAFIGTCARGSAFAGATHLKDTLCSTLLLREKGSGTREIFENECRAMGLSVNDYRDICEIGHVPTLLRLAASDMGITFCYETAAAELLSEGTLVRIPLEDFSLCHAFYLLSLPGSPAMERLPDLPRLLRTWAVEAAGPAI